MKTVYLAEFIDIYNHNLNLTNGRMAQLKRATNHLNSRTAKLTIAGVVFGVYCYYKIKKQQEQIRQLNKEVKELREEQDNAALSKEINDILD